MTTHARSWLFATIWIAMPLTAGADDLPVRKSGQWKITSISATHGMVTIMACVGANDSIAAVTSDGRCTAPDVQHVADQVIVNVTCTTPQGREKTSTLSPATSRPGIAGS